MRKVLVVGEGGSSLIKLLSGELKANSIEIVAVDTTEDAMEMTSDMIVNTSNLQMELICPMPDPMWCDYGPRVQNKIAKNERRRENRSKRQRRQ